MALPKHTGPPILLLSYFYLQRLLGSRSCCVTVVFVYLAFFFLFSTKLKFHLIIHPLYLHCLKWSKTPHWKQHLLTQFCNLIQPQAQHFCLLPNTAYDDETPFRCEPFLSHATGVLSEWSHSHTLPQLANFLQCSVFDRRLVFLLDGPQKVFEKRRQPCATRQNRMRCKSSAM